MTKYKKEFKYRGYSFATELTISDDEKAFEIFCRLTGIDKYSTITEGENLLEVENSILLIEKKVKDYVDFKLTGKESLEDRLLKLGFNSVWV